jgi:hypothetical protein
MNDTWLLFEEGEVGEDEDDDEGCGELALVVEEETAVGEMFCIKWM